MGEVIDVDEGIVIRESMSNCNEVNGGQIVLRKTNLVPWWAKEASVVSPSHAISKFGLATFKAWLLALSSHKFGGSC